MIFHLVKREFVPVFTATKPKQITSLRRSPGSTQNMVGFRPRITLLKNKTFELTIAYFLIKERVQRNANTPFNLSEFSNPRNVEEISLKRHEIHC